jgi:hypothetical protein
MSELGSCRAGHVLTGSRVLKLHIGPTKVMLESGIELDDVLYALKVQG